MTPGVVKCDSNVEQIVYFVCLRAPEKESNLD